jgi:hypothetical protein
MNRSVLAMLLVGASKTPKSDNNQITGFSCKVSVYSEVPVDRL